MVPTATIGVGVLSVSYREVRAICLVMHGLLATLHRQQTKPDTKVPWNLPAEWRILLPYSSAEWETFGVKNECILVVELRPDLVWMALRHAHDARSSAHVTLAET